MSNQILHHLTMPGESAEYRTARNKLLTEEMALRRQIESVAAARRALPAGGTVAQDYVFDGDEGPLKLSGFFPSALELSLCQPERKPDFNWEWKNGGSKWLLLCDRVASRAQRVARA